MTTRPRDYHGLSTEDKPSDLRADSVKIGLALANVYAKTFLAWSKNGSQDTSYTFGHILEADHIGVTKVAFNATEFRTEG